MRINIRAFGSVLTQREIKIYSRILEEKIMKRGNVLLVGGTGFIGYHLVLRLIKLGFKVF